MLRDVDKIVLLKRLDPHWLAAPCGAVDGACRGMCGRVCGWAVDTIYTAGLLLAGPVDESVRVCGWVEGATRGSSRGMPVQGRKDDGDQKVREVVGSGSRA